MPQITMNKLPKHYKNEKCKCIISKGTQKNDGHCLGMTSCRKSFK